MFQRISQVIARCQRSLPSCLVSLVLHLVFLIALALIGFPEVRRSIFLLEGRLESTADSSIKIQSFSELALSAIQEPIEQAVENSDSINVPPPDFPGTFEVASFAWIRETDGGSPATSIESATTILADSNRSATLTKIASAASISQTLDGRSADRKAMLLSRYGGSQGSEDAIALALHWLADHQADDGGWSFAHDRVCNGQCSHAGGFVAARNGATGIALLPFLGAGHTHVEGAHQKTVNDGLEYLKSHMQRTMGGDPSGSWFEAQGTMYSHCLATIAVSEAYAMTGDSSLRPYAQAGIDFLVQSQNKTDGGWRYSPGARGDTSVVGWAVMALKSGEIGGLEVPQPTLNRTWGFLNQVSSGGGSTYGYTSRGHNPHGLEATTAIGLLCRMYEGWPKDRVGLSRGVGSLSKTGPRLNNLYYSYYAAQVMRHHGGPQWETWNAKMRDPLVKMQIKQRHASGSWTPTGMPDMGGAVGGRLYCTAMATMILEVYYRHMPLYSDQVLDDDFEL